MIYFLLKHLLVSIFSFIHHLPIILWHLFSCKFFVYNKEEFLMNFFYIILLPIGNYLIIDSLSLYHEVYMITYGTFPTPEEINDLFEEKKNNNSYQNDENFLTKFILKILISLFLCYVFDNLENSL